MVANRLKDKVALITGASSGIGAALAVEYARQGADVVLTARRSDRLEEVAERVRGHGCRALAVTCDVTVDGDLERATAAAVESFGRIDRVIANAGFGVSKPLSKLELEDYRRQFETNVFGVLRTVYATRDALEQSRGCLAIIGSVAGYVAMPGSSPYSMSKAAVHKLAESLRHEFARFGVGVTSIVPGFIKSEIRMVDNRGVLHPDARDRLPDWLPMAADVAARKIVRAVERRKRILVMTGHGKFVVLLQRHFPGLLAGLVHRFGNRVRRDKQ
jgi:short-subunit dehydrogenase